MFHILLFIMMLASISIPTASLIGLSKWTREGMFRKIRDAIFDPVTQYFNKCHAGEVQFNLMDYKELRDLVRKDADEYEDKTSLLMDSIWWCFGFRNKVLCKFSFYDRIKHLV